MGDINPRMLYNKHFINLKAGAGPREFYDSPYGNFSILNNFKIPSVELIQNHQMNVLKNAWQPSKEKAQSFLNELNIFKNGSYQWTQQDLGMFLQQLRKRLKEENYHIYTEGQKFEYDNAKRIVESNEILVAIKH